MNAKKENNLKKVFGGDLGSRTAQAILDQIPEILWNRLTGEDLGHVAIAINSAYHKGKNDEYYRSNE